MVLVAEHYKTKPITINLIKLSKVSCAAAANTMAQLLTQRDIEPNRLKMKRCASLATVQHFHRLKHLKLIFIDTIHALEIFQSPSVYKNLITCYIELDTTVHFLSDIVQFLQDCHVFEKLTNFVLRPISAKRLSALSLADVFEATFDKMPKLKLLSMPIDSDYILSETVARDLIASVQRHLTAVKANVIITHVGCIKKLKSVLRSFNDCSYTNGCIKLTYDEYYATIETSNHNITKLF